MDIEKLVDAALKQKVGDLPESIKTLLAGFDVSQTIEEVFCKLQQILCDAIEEHEFEKAAAARDYNVQVEDWCMRFFILDYLANARDVIESHTIVPALSLLIRRRISNIRSVVYDKHMENFRVKNSVPSH